MTTMDYSLLSDAEVCKMHPFNVYMVKGKKPTIATYKKKRVEVIDPATGKPKPKKEPRNVLFVVLGELKCDGTIAWSKAALEQFPYFKGRRIYYADRKLLSKSEYKRHLSQKLAKEDEDLTATVVHMEGDSPVKSCGVSEATYAVAEKMGMNTALQRVFGREKAGRYLGLVQYLVDTQGKPMYLYEDESRDNLYFNCLRWNPSEISNVLSEIKEDEIEAFWHEMLRNPRFVGQMLVMPYDITSISTYSSTITMAERGRNKQNEKLKQVNVALGIDSKTLTPLFHKVFPGSVPDIAILKDHMHSFFKGGFEPKKIWWVLDRGFPSQSNIDRLFQKGCEFTMGGLDTLKEVKNVFETQNQHLNDLESADNVIETAPCDEFICGKWLMSMPYYWVDEANIEHCRELYYYVYKNHSLAIKQRIKLQEAKKIFNEIQRQRAANRHKKNPASLPESVYECLRSAIEPTDDPLIQALNPQKFNLLHKRAGTFFLLCSKKLSASEVYGIYKHRNVAEEFFDKLKNDLEGRRLYCTEKTLQGTLFMLMLASAISFKMQKLLGASSSYKNTPLPKVLGALRRIMVTTGYNSYQLTDPLSAEEERLLNIFGVNFKKRRYLMSQS